MVGGAEVLFSDEVGVVVWAAQKAENKHKVSFMSLWPAQFIEFIASLNPEAIPIAWKGREKHTPFEPEFHLDLARDLFHK